MWCPTGVGTSRYPYTTSAKAATMVNTGIIFIEAGSGQSGNDVIEYEGYPLQEKGSTRKSLAPGSPQLKFWKRMKNIIVVNGEADWQDYFPGYSVHYRRIQNSSWLYHQNTLWVFDASGSLRVDAVLWRVGAIKPQPEQRHALELIRMADIPCLNPAAVLLRGYDRLSMLNELRETGLPVQTFSVALGERMLDLLHPNFPAVLKVGNFHGGFGKMRAENEEQWADARDMAFVTSDYATLEPYIDYARDIRCLAVGDQIWAMARRGITWKANTQTQEYKIILAPAQLEECTRKAVNHLQADVLALDFLEKHDGSYVLLESNDIPGFSGFPKNVRETVATRLRRKLESVS